MKPPSTTAVGFNPFLTGDTSDSSIPPASTQWPTTNEEQQQQQQWPGKTSEDAAPSPQWTPSVPRTNLEGALPTDTSWAKNGESSESDEPVGATATDVVSCDVSQQPSEMVNSALRNPFGAMQQNAQALHTAGVSATVITPQQSDMPTFGAPPSGASSENASPIHFGINTQTAPPPPPPPPPAMMPNQNLTIYEQTPFSRMDGSYTSSPVIPRLLHQQAAAAHAGVQNISGGNRIICLLLCTHSKLFIKRFGTGTANLNAYGAQQLPSLPPSASTQAGKFTGGDLDSALSSLADNLSVSGKGTTNQGKPVQWNNQGGVRPAGGAHPVAQPQYGAIPPQQWPPMGLYAPQPGIYAQQPMIGMYAQPGYNPQMQQAAAPVYGIAPGQTATQAGQTQQVAPPPPHRPFM
uniref:Uncharacterized protein n=1 Tax=Setaria digitata TaxID=48799 RepID=A0A915Q728_9BILA